LLIKGIYLSAMQSLPGSRKHLSLKNPEHPQKPKISSRGYGARLQVKKGGLGSKSFSRGNKQFGKMARAERKGGVAAAVRARW
jgi:hypothetical protein